MGGCAIIDVTEGGGTSTYGQSIETGISGADQGSVSACESEGQIEHFGGVLCGMRTIPEYYLERPHSHTMTPPEVSVQYSVFRSGK